MDRCAVFVDAGYLFAQGSVQISGRKLPRADLLLNSHAAVNSLIDLACQKAGGCKILRVYWYDGAIGGSRPTSDQALLASLDNVKLRLGFLNSNGQQKGVDSLIVTDMIELARLNSITDALLLSGDEDVRVGVQLAQNYGVRVHLLGIAPARSSQSQQLQHEADTTSEWTREQIAAFLSVRETVETTVRARVEAHAPAPASAASTTEAIGELEAVVRSFVTGLLESDVNAVTAYWETARGVPSDLDGKLLTLCRTAIGRSLDRAEARAMRSCFQRAVMARRA